MPIPNVTPYTGTLPDINDPVTFDARMTAFTTWFNSVVTEIKNTTDGMNTALNDDGTVLDTAGEALDYSKNANTSALTAGSATAYTITPSETISAYADGQSFRIRMHATNTGAATLNVNALGALPIQKRNSGGSLVALSSGDLQINEYHLVEVVSGGTAFEVISESIQSVVSVVQPLIDQAVSDAGWQYLPQQTTTSGTDKDFTIPAGAKEVVINFDQVNVNGLNDILIYLGTSGGIISTGYVTSSGWFFGNAAQHTEGTTAAVVFRNGAHVITGEVTLRRVSETSEKWNFSGNLKRGGSGMITVAGQVVIPSALTTVRVSSVLFTGGALDVMWR